MKKVIPLIIILMSMFTSSYATDAADDYDSCSESGLASCRYVDYRIVYEVDTELEFKTSNYILHIFTREVSGNSSGSFKVYTHNFYSLEHQEFLFKYFNISVSAFLVLYGNNVYNGRASSIIQLASDYDIVDTVENTTNSIGYISDGRAVVNIMDTVKVIKLEAYN
jgi:hypothetical protein